MIFMVRVVIERSFSKVVSLLYIFPTTIVLFYNTVIYSFYDDELMRKYACQSDESTCTDEIANVILKVKTYRRSYGWEI